MAQRRLIYLVSFVLGTLCAVELVQHSPLSARVAAGITMALVVAGGVFFLGTIVLWSPRCPKCVGGKAKSTNKDGEEYLVCRSCAYEEPTGWVYGTRKKK